MVKCARKDIMYLPNFIEVSEDIFFDFSKINPRQFLFVGRLSIEKGVEIAIKAIDFLIKEENLRDIKLKIIGDGSERKNLEKLTNELSLQDNIIFLGRIPNKKLSQNVKYIVIFDSQIVPDEKWENLCWMPESFVEKIRKIYPKVYKTSFNDIRIYKV